MKAGLGSRNLKLRCALQAVSIVAGICNATDLGVRPGAANAGAAVRGVDARYFANVRAAFNEVYSIAGDVESGSGLGPRFNGTSCGGCHAYPATGGSSPRHNPQFAMAAAHGATNRVPGFLKPDGPVRTVRAKSGDVRPLFTVNGRSDAYGCTVRQPDFSGGAQLSFRIPTPVFGAGFIDNIPDKAILANRESQFAAKSALGIAGRPNIGSAGTVGRFGWKAQHHSITAFAQDAYRTEMGVRTGRADYERESLSTVCYALYEAAFNDANFASSYDSGEQPSVFLFTEFMRFLDAPGAVTQFPGATAEAVARGRRLFEQTGCSLCHTPLLRTGEQSDLPALNARDVYLYSDLLLHHMGPKLADGVVQGRAGPDEFRTSPLWGIGQRVFFLHDGRTSDLWTAILEHSSDGEGLHSEATATIERLKRLSPADRQKMLNFLRSL